KIEIRSSPNTEFYVQLEEQYKETLAQFAALLQKPNAEDDDVLAKFYEVTRSDDKKQTRQYQKEMSRILYQLTLTENQGPRIPLLVQTVGLERFVSLISFN